MAAARLKSTPRSDTHKHPFFNEEGLSTMNQNNPDNTAKAHVPWVLDEQAEWEFFKEYAKHSRPH